MDADSIEEFQELAEELEGHIFNYKSKPVRISRVELTLTVEDEPKEYMILELEYLEDDKRIDLVIREDEDIEEKLDGFRNIHPDEIVDVILEK